jgi:hypothetical protein
MLYLLLGSDNGHRMDLADKPILVFLAALVAQSVAAYIGARLRRAVKPLSDGEHADFDTVLTATLTLLVLIIGFSFSMAVNRYDQRKNYEEGEANAIGTEYLRAGLLPDEDAARLRVLLKAYVKQRIAFYDDQPADAVTGKLQNELWSAVANVTKTRTDPVMGLVVSGMNDVVNAQGYTQAAFLNRIPAAAWWLMVLMAIFSNAMLGYRERSDSVMLLLVLPIISSIAFLLIADIDSPRGGLIRVHPQNLVLTSQSM